jgi:hypothetical protein
VRRLVATWQQEHEHWQRRDLSTRHYVDVWADGVYFTPRLDHDRQCILVVIGGDAHGNKELLAIEDGFRESAKSWRELLLRLRDENGLKVDPELATGDGGLGFWKALHEIWPKRPGSNAASRASWPCPLRIGIGRSLAAPLSHTTGHTGPYHGGSLDRAALGIMDGRPSAARSAFESAMSRAGLAAILRLRARRP